MTKINSALSPDELARYHRHIILPECGIAGQQKLKDSKVLVVGAGGLGSPLLLYLAAAGIGQIGIIDEDVIDTSNLQRQVLYSSDQIGRPKATAAAERVKSINPLVNVSVYEATLTARNAKQIISEYDIVADGTDNFPTRYLVNDACVLLGKTNVYASIFQFEGQVTVFNHLNEAGERGPNYRDLFASPPPPGLVPSCAAGGVLGVLPGIIGAMQALEVIKIVTGIGDLLSGRLFIFDASSFISHVLSIRKDPQNPLTGTKPTIHDLIDYEGFCQLNTDDTNVKSISVADFFELLDAGSDFQLIDVREEIEFAHKNLGGELIPIDEIDAQHHRISRHRKVIVYCKSGKRSERAIRRLEQQYRFDNLYNLEGGIDACLKARSYLAKANNVGSRFE